MNFNEYQRRAVNLNLCPQQHKFLHAVLGLPGEVGEICEKIKKVFRDRDGEFPPDFKQDMKKELGDVLWYISDLSAVFGIDLEDVAAYNIEKLESRKQRGTLTGSGDNR
jgi:NTP pyrophosphatase (non-canonical NTP hydrolase)